MNCDGIIVKSYGSRIMIWTTAKAKAKAQAQAKAQRYPKGETAPDQATS